jgi:hypothetical protein
VRSASAPGGEGESGVDLPTGVFGGASRDVASERGCALGHAAQSVACGGRRRSRGDPGRSVVTHIDVKYVSFDAERYDSVRGGRVGHDVGDRLLDDPEAGLLYRERNHVTIELHVSLGVDAGRLCTLQQWPHRQVRTAHAVAVGEARPSL